MSDDMFDFEDVRMADSSSPKGVSTPLHPRGALCAESLSPLVASEVLGGGSGKRWSASVCDSLC